jgi:hypothetical protein
MISLKDSIEIHATPGQVFAWLGRMPQEYLAWHPDHVACRVIHGSMLEVGSEMEFEEYLHGKLHSLRFRMTKVLPGKRVEFEVVGMGLGAFEAQAVDDHVRFIAELKIGTKDPLIGRLFDWIFAWLFKRRIAGMRQHMAEEGEYLKTILETEAFNQLDAT